MKLFNNIKQHQLLAIEFNKAKPYTALTITTTTIKQSKYKGNYADKVINNNITAIYFQSKIKQQPE